MNITISTSLCTEAATMTTTSSSGALSTLVTITSSIITTQPQLDHPNTIPTTATSPTTIQTITASHPLLDLNPAATPATTTATTNSSASAAAEKSHHLTTLTIAWSLSITLSTLLILALIYAFLGKRHFPFRRRIHDPSSFNTVIPPGRIPRPEEIDTRRSAEIRDDERVRLAAERERREELAARREGRESWLGWEMGVLGRSGVEAAVRGVRGERDGEGGRKGEGEGDEVGSKKGDGVV